MKPPLDTSDYWEHRLREHFDDQGVGFLRLGRRYNRWMYRVRGQVFDRVVDDRVIGLSGKGEPLRVLDVGSGTGFYVDRWRRLGAEVTGVDLTEVAVERLSKAFPGSRFIKSDIGATLNGELQPFVGVLDVVSAFDVLFHIVDDDAYARALANMARLLRPGGLLLWSDNFVHGPTVRAPHHVSRSLDEIGSALENAGLEVIDRVPMFVLMNEPTDTESPWLRPAWKVMMFPALLSDRLGGLLGALLYPLERLLVRRLHESPTTELMVCMSKPAVGARRASV